MPLTKTWTKRFKLLEETGNCFSYNEMADMLGISRANVSVTLSGLRDEYGDAIIESELDGKKLFTFDYDVLLGEGEDEAPVELPAWLSRETYDNIVDALELGEDEVPQFAKQDGWNARWQRGGLRCEVFEDGQKYPERGLVFRVDNCVVISKAEAGA
jgi:biotin operon repressor